MLAYRLNERGTAEHDDPGKAHPPHPLEVIDVDLSELEAQEAIPLSLQSTHNNVNN